MPDLKVDPRSRLPPDIYYELRDRICCRWSRSSSSRSSRCRSCSANGSERRLRRRRRRGVRSARRSGPRSTVVESRARAARLPQAAREPDLDQPLQAALHRAGSTGPSSESAKARHRAPSEASTTTTKPKSTRRPKSTPVESKGRRSGDGYGGTRRRWTTLFDLRDRRTDLQVGGKGGRQRRCGSRPSHTGPAADAAAGEKAPVVTYLGPSQKGDNPAAAGLQRSEVACSANGKCVSGTGAANCSKSSRASRTTSSMARTTSANGSTS